MNREGFLSLVFWDFNGAGFGRLSFSFRVIKVVYFGAHRVPFSKVKMTLFAQLHTNFNLQPWINIHQNMIINIYSVQMLMLSANECRKSRTNVIEWKEWMHNTCIENENWKTLKFLPLLSNLHIIGLTTLRVESSRKMHWPSPSELHIETRRSGIHAGLLSRG